MVSIMRIFAITIIASSIFGFVLGIKEGYQILIQKKYDDINFLDEITGKNDLQSYYKKEQEMLRRQIENPTLSDTDLYLWQTDRKLHRQLEDDLAFDKKTFIYLVSILSGGLLTSLALGIALLSIAKILAILKKNNIPAKSAELDTDKGLS
jgi:hypothetical protein